MMLFLFCCLIGGAGIAASEAMWRGLASHVPLNRYERIASAALTSTIFWLMVAWALAIPRWMSATTLLIGAIMIAIIAALAWLRAPRTTSQPRLPIERVALLALVPLLLWIGYLLWRGYVAPPIGPDTLSYHMPRALMLARAGGYQQFQLPDPRVNDVPANYELLLATIIQLTHSDTLVEWLSTGFVVLFLLLTAAIARRWWTGNEIPVAATILGVAAAPLVILHGAALKNDVMTACFFLAALHFSARWRSSPNPPSALLAIASVCAAIGTKPHGLALAACIGLFAITAIVRAARVSWRSIAALIVFALIAMSLLGGAYYLDRIRHDAATATSTESKVATLTSSTWGEWRNLWEVPAMLLIAPFAPNDDAVPVPWSHTDRLWNRYDLHASHYGPLVSLLALALPFVIWRFRRDGDAHVIAERWHISLATLLTSAITLPIRSVPRGYVSGFPRYLLFTLPIVVCWTVPPLLQVLRRYAIPLLSFIAVVFSLTAISYSIYDRWSPFWAMRWAAARPGVRWVPSETRRAEFVADKLAPPDASIAIHGGVDSWVYPAYGRELRRDVQYINDASEIRPTTDWIAIDRVFGVMWVHPRFTNMDEWRKYVGGGPATAGDLRVLEELQRDPRFELVFINRGLVQAVFHRKRPGT